ncbi:AC4 protein [Sida chlorotic leaf virus]|uniref:AC4 protein n=1 Tax=Sida chlorotic leaf virus TaxID=2593923 RepID=A0A514TTP1_9GEMI|nr:AC4 protein [Sida chlorotic leaf virus]QDJ95889.1 AC4 protein [Sida chlorotic leaf virus]
MKMGSLISMCLYSSKGSSTAQITDYSIWCPQPGLPISTQTYKELNPAPTSSPTSRKTVTPSNGGCSRSTEEVLAAVSRHLTTQPPRR